MALICLLYIFFSPIGQQDSQIQSDSRKYKVNNQAPPIKMKSKAELIQKDIVGAKSDQDIETQKIF
mgnify:FL=1